MGISLLLIALNSLGLAWFLSNNMAREMLQRDAVVSMQFVNSIVRVQGATDYFHGDKQTANTPAMEEFFRHVADLPDVVRANVYGADRSMLWSSNRDLIGMRFEANPDLEKAFEGRQDPGIKQVDRDRKPEHVNFPMGVTSFVEFYVPIWSESRDRVVGAVEVYKVPVQLLNAIEMIRRYVWIGSLLGAAALYAAILVVARHARRLLRAQEARTVEAERLAVVGEMASAVAHGLRNPLASIRSCAELALDDAIPEATRQPIQDIIDQSDRLERWIRSFLEQSRGHDDSTSQPLQIDSVINECVDAFRHQMSSRGIRPLLSCEGASPIVLAHSAELGQVFNSVIANSIEAIEHDGEIRIERRLSAQGMVHIDFIDTGPGIAPEVLDRLFKPFSTTKSSGLGVGLALARRIVERLGGTVEIANAAKRGAGTGADAVGARVTVRVPAMKLAS